MISSLMIITSLAMFAFPKQLRGNRIPAPHEQIDSIDAHKSSTKMEQQQQLQQQPDEDAPPTLKGINSAFFVSCMTFFLMISKCHHEFADFPKTIKKHLKNDILMFRTASSVLHLLPIAGLYTFLPKYLESQFHLATHDASLVTAFGGILVMGIGIVASAFVLLKFSPTARSVAAWIAFTALIYSAGMAVLMFIGCPLDNIVGLNDVKVTDSFIEQ